MSVHQKTFHFEVRTAFPLLCVRLRKVTSCNHLAADFIILVSQAMPKKEV